MGEEGIGDLFDDGVMKAPAVFNLQGTFLHNIGDDDRALMVADALGRAARTKGKEHEAALLEFGRLEKESYESLRDNYRNSSPNIDEIARWAMAQAWCLGPRHFGAGWGGWMEIWVKPGRYEEAARAIREFLKDKDQYRESMVERYKPGAPAGLLGVVNRAKVIRSRCDAASKLINIKANPDLREAALAVVKRLGEVLVGPMVNVSEDGDTVTIEIKNPTGTSAGIMITEHMKVESRIRYEVSLLGERNVSRYRFASYYADIKDCAMDVLDALMRLESWPDIASLPRLPHEIRSAEQAASGAI